MEGFYVDASHCLNIITLPETIKKARDQTYEQATVYRASSDDPSGRRARLTRDSSQSLRVHLHEGDASARDGVYDGSDRIQWDDGTQWHRIEISHEQASLMTRRPYIPVTFLFLACASALVSWVSEATIAVWSKRRGEAKRVA